MPRNGRKQADPFLHFNPSTAHFDKQTSEREAQAAGAGKPVPPLQDAVSGSVFRSYNPIAPRRRKAAKRSGPTSSKRHRTGLSPTQSLDREGSSLGGPNEPFATSQSLHSRQPSDLAVRARSDTEFKDAVIAELESFLRQGNKRSIRLRRETWGGHTAIQNLALLRSVREPFTSEGALQDAWDIDHETFLADTTKFTAAKIPIFSHRPLMAWADSNSRVEQALVAIGSEDLEIDVNDGATPLNQPSATRVSLKNVKKRLLSATPRTQTWNLLDLQTPFPNIQIPWTGDDATLLQFIQTQVTRSGKRKAWPSTNFEGWQQVEKWMLIAEGGAQTAPHTDSNGYATWLCVQEGEVGFGWLASKDEPRERWLEDAASTEGRWCYRILRQDDMVLFPTGTIHFVFRRRGKPTLAFGGHVLQWSEIIGWAEFMVRQVKDNSLTNEEMVAEGKPLMYLKAVEELLAFPEYRSKAGCLEVTKKFKSLVKEYHEYLSQISPQL